MFIAVRGDISDQKYGPSAYVKEAVVTNRNALLQAMAITNKGSGTAWIQIYDAAGGVIAAASITACVIATGVLTIASHGFVTGQKVATVSLPGITNGNYYVRKLSANTFTLHTTYEAAWANTNIQYPNSAVAAGTVAGIVDTSICNAEEYPLPTNSVLSVQMKRFVQGIYVRGVTAADGSTLISASDLKIVAHYATTPLVRDDGGVS